MKRHLKTLLASCFLILGVVFLFPAQKAEAYGITQTDATTDSVTISWEAPSYYTPINYKVSLGHVDEDYNTTWELVQTLSATQTSTVLTGLEAGSHQKIKITYDYYNYSNVLTEATLASSYTGIYTLPGKVTNVKQERWYYFILTFNATWDKQDAVDGYEYYVYKSNGKVKEKGTVTSNSLSVNDISNSMVYTVKVRAYKTINGEKVYGAWSKKAYFFTQPRVTKAKVSSKKLTVKWGKVNGATGYDVYVSTKETSGYKKVKSVGKNTRSVTIKKFKGKKISSKKTYYVYVVTKKKVGSTTYKSGKLYYWNTKQSTDKFGYF